MSKWRTMVRSLVLLLAVGVVLVLALHVYGRFRVARARSVFAREVGSLDLASYERPAVPAAENAAHWLEAGARVLALSSEESRLLSDARKVRERLTTPEGREDVRALLDRYAVELEILQRAAPLPSSSYDIAYREGFRARIPDQRHLRAAAALLRADALYALSTGRFEQVLTDVRVLSRLVVSLADEPLLPNVIFSMSCEEMLFDVVAAVLESPAVHDVAFWQALGSVLPANDLVASLRRALSIEAASIQNADIGSLSVQFTVAAPLRGLMEAQFLDSLRRELSLVEQPIRAWPREAVVETPSGVRLDLLLVRALKPHLLTYAYLRTADRRQLLQAAIKLRVIGTAEEYPTELSTADFPEQHTRLTREPLVYSRGPEGSALIELPPIDAAVPQSSSLASRYRAQIRLPAAVPQGAASILRP